MHDARTLSTAGAFSRCGLAIASRAVQGPGYQAPWCHEILNAALLPWCPTPHGACPGKFTLGLQTVDSACLQRSSNLHQLARAIWGRPPPAAPSRGAAVAVSCISGPHPDIPQVLHPHARRHRPGQHGALLAACIQRKAGGRCKRACVLAGSEAPELQDKWRSQVSSMRRSAAEAYRW